MRILDIGYILIDNINNKNDLNKINLINAIETYKKEVKEKKEDEMYRYNKYINDYENKRKDNNDKYEQFLRENNYLYNKWKKSNKTIDFYAYITHKKPDYEEIEDIYTINPISQH